MCHPSWNIATLESNMIKLIGSFVHAFCLWLWPHCRHLTASSGRRPLLPFFGRIVPPAGQIGAKGKTAAWHSPKAKFTLPNYAKCWYRLIPGMRKVWCVKEKSHFLRNYKKLWMPSHSCMIQYDETAKGVVMKSDFHRPSSNFWILFQGYFFAKTIVCHNGFRTVSMQASWQTSATEYIIPGCR